MRIELKHKIPPNIFCFQAAFWYAACFPQGCSSPVVVKFADTQKDKEQKRIAQQLQQQMQQLNAASMWGNLTGLNSLGPQYLAVSTHSRSALLHTDATGCMKCRIMNVEMHFAFLKNVNLHWGINVLHTKLKLLSLVNESCFVLRANCTF